MAAPGPGSGGAANFKQLTVAHSHRGALQAYAGFAQARGRRLAWEGVEKWQALGDDVPMRARNGRCRTNGVRHCCGVGRGAPTKEQLEQRGVRLPGGRRVGPHQESVLAEGKTVLSDRILAVGPQGFFSQDSVGGRWCQRRAQSLGEAAADTAFWGPNQLYGHVVHLQGSALARRKLRRRRPIPWIEGECVV